MVEMGRTTYVPYPTLPWQAMVLVPLLWYGMVG